MRIGDKPQNLVYYGLQQQAYKNGFLVMRLSPSSTLASVAAAFFIALIVVVWFSTQERITGLTWTSEADTVVVEGELPGLDAPQAVMAIRVQGKEFRLQPLDIMPEPDVLETFHEVDNFWLRQGQISALLANPEISLLLDSNQEVIVPVREKTLLEVSASFWLLNLAGFLGLMITAGVWGYRPNLTSARIFFLCGIGFALISMMLAYYSTRELAIPEPIFRAAHAVNRLGMIFLNFGGAALLWHYPSQLGRFPFARVILFIGMMFWVNETFIKVELFIHSYFDMFFLCTFISVINGYRQWRRSANQPLERAALRWLLLSFLICFTAIWLLYVTPILLTNELKLNLVLAIWIVLCIFLGIAVGISRYKIFDLEKWWLAVWLWFISGLLVFVIDIALITLLDFGFVSSLTLTILIVGWLYFPIRQRVLKRFMGRQASPLKELLPKILAFMLSPHTREKSAEFWRQLIEDAIRPIQVESIPCNQKSFAIEDDGMVLKVPGLYQECCYELAGCDGGRRLFSESDISVLNQCYELMQFGEQQYQLREEATNRERERIMRDLHDDVGAKLLTLIHRVPDAYGDMARSALTTLRETIFSMASDNDMALDELLATLREEFSDRCEAADVTLHWQVPETGSCNVSAHVQINLTRVMRECLTNSLKHGQPANVWVNMSLTEYFEISIQVEHDGSSEPVSAWKANNGMLNMIRRMNELAGSISFTDREGTGIRMHLLFPVPKN